MNRNSIAGLIFLFIAASIFIFVGFKNVPRASAPLVFSEKNMLQALWIDYKNTYIEKDTGRALDIQQNNITTSEGQSYTLLRAVWMDDKETFDLALKWTKDNLDRREDNLSSWLFGERANGTYGVLTDRGGYNSATDADIDIALALIFAAERWGDDGYRETAQGILDSIWEKEVAIFGGRPYLMANNLEKFSSERPIVNPSYFAPYAYRIFATVDEDPKHDWEELVDTSYEILKVASASPLDKNTSAGLPPDWIVLSRNNPAQVGAANVGELTTNFGYDALRIPWRIALDYKWFKEPRAKEYLDSLGFLSAQWEEKKFLKAVYSHDGSIVGDYEAPAMYGGTIGYFGISRPEQAKEVYEQKLKFLFDANTNTFKNQLSYYDANWVWFGMALYSDLLPNLTE